MKKLYIIRHAKSSWNFDVADHDRPLGFRGRKDVKNMGVFLSRNVDTPDLIISSTASRAINTALSIADDWGYPEEDIIITKSLYHANSKEIITILKEQEADTIAIFGHNPGFTELANEFEGDYINNIPTTGCVGIEFDIDNWKEIDNDNSKRVFSHSPKSIKMNRRS